jgi:hypothetical protein
MICAECLLGVSEVHAGLGIGVQLVVDAGAVAHGTLDDDDGLGAIHIEMGMPAIGEPRWRAAGVGHVVRLLPGDVCLRGECIHRLGAAERVEQHVPNSPR